MRASCVCVWCACFSLAVSLLRIPPLSGDYGQSPGLGLLRLHSTFRHDLKIYASDEGRVQMTAAAFGKVSWKYLSTCLRANYVVVCGCALTSTETCFLTVWTVGPPERWIILEHWCFWLEASSNAMLTRIGFESWSLWWESITLTT